MLIITSTINHQMIEVFVTLAIKLFKIVRGVIIILLVILVIMGMQ